METEEILNIIQASLKICAENIKARHWTMVGHDFMTYHPYFDDTTADLMVKITRKIRDKYLFFLIQSTRLSFS